MQNFQKQELNKRPDEEFWGWDEEQCWEKLGELPNCAEAHLRLGQLFQNNKDFNQSKSHLLRSLALSPALYPALAHEWIGDAVSKPDKDFSQALQHYSIAISHYPTCELHIKAGKSQEKLKNLKSAAIHYSAAIDLNSTHPWALLRLGWVYIRQNNSSDGMRLLEKANELLPHTPQILTRLGEAHCKINELPRAVKFL